MNDCTASTDVNGRAARKSWARACIPHPTGHGPLSGYVCRIVELRASARSRESRHLLLARQPQMQCSLIYCPCFVYAEGLRIRCFVPDYLWISHMFNSRHMRDKQQYDTLIQHVNTKTNIVEARRYSFKTPCGQQGRCFLLLVISL